MRARVAKVDPAASQSESLLLWSGPPMDGLSEFAAAQWKDSAVVDLIDTPQTDQADPDGYFKRMAENLHRIGDCLE